MTRYVDRLCSELFSRAKSLSWPVVEQPPQLERRDFAPLIEDDVAAGPAEPASPDRKRGAANDQTSADAAYRRSAFIGDYPVLVGSFGDDVLRAKDVLFHHHEQAARARTHLGARKENLLLILVGPPVDPTNDRGWIDRAYETERDERLCRKMVFLPPIEERRLAQEIEQFLGRTFLARPWDVENEEADLDPLRTTLTTAEIPPEWVELITNRTLEGEQLAKALIRVLPGNPKGRS